MKKFIRTFTAVLAVLVAAVVAYYLYDIFRERTHTEELADIIHLEDTRQLSEKLTGYLDRDDLELRVRTALAVGRIGDRRSPAILYNLLGDSAIDVAATAAFALGLTGDKTIAARLLDRALDLPSVVTARAVEAAGRLADSSMTDVIESLAGFLSHPSPDVREAACYGLASAGAMNKGTAVLDLFKTEPDSIVREAAFYTLARLGIDEATPEFIQILADPDPYLRSLALRGLSRSSSNKAAHYTAISLNDSDPCVVAQAVYGLQRLKDSGFVDNLVKKLRDEKDENLTLELIKTLQMLKTGAGAELVEMFFKSRPSDNIVAAGLTYLATVRGDRAVGIIDSVLSEVPPAFVRAACAEAYGIVDKGGIISRLGTLFGDEDPMVRGAAFSVLTRLDSNNVDYYIKKALNDPDFMLNILAVDKIMENKYKSYLPTLKTVMSRGPEIDIDLRRSIVTAAGAFLREDSTDQTALEILIKGTLDKEYVIRKDAAEIYEQVLGEDYFYLVPPAHTRIKESEIESAIKKYTTNPYAMIMTSKGEIEMELYFDVAPLTVLNFIKLARAGYFDGLSFHRVIPNFVVQGGDPRGDGWGGPGYSIRCEYSEEPYRRGTVGMATSGKDTGDSQFFIALSPQPHLAGRYTVFGQVLEGMDAVDEIVHGDLIEKVIIRETLP
ncbi:MAG: peptidylprolyl isomerase [candidate division Zixibacteria bacterium]|nr:peptidylprolyl isomerase [candidate division Zixibacteria bacterium]